MNLKNNALQELYDTIVNGTFTFSPGADDPIDKAFRECDEKLSGLVTFEHLKNLQDSNYILNRSNANLLAANMEAIGKKRKLEKDLDNAKSRAKHAEAEVEDLKKELQDAKRLIANTNCLREEVIWYRKHFNNSHKQGQKDLWDKLREVADATSSELLGCFADVCELEDLIEWDLEDFMNEYKEWQEKKDQKRTKEIRQAECFNEMYADMTVVDYPERFV